MTDLPLLDIPAWAAYGVVLLGGMITAWQNVKRMLADHPGYWLVPGTWLLYLLYVVIPLVLFWFLDYAGVVDDTSFFAALLVGFAYQQIMTGGINAIGTVPGAPARVWQPFQAYAQRLADRIAERQVTRTATAHDRLTGLLSAGGAGRLAALVLEHHPEPGRLVEALDRIEQETAVTPAGASPDEVAEARARRTVDHLLRELRRYVPESWPERLRARGLIDRPDLWRLRHRTADLVSVLVIAAILGAGAVSARVLFTHPAQDRYHAWRLAKRSVTSWDHVRALAWFQEHDPSLAEHADVLTPVVRRLGVADLEPATVRRILQSVALVRRPELDPVLVPHLVTALQTASPESRLVIHGTLLAIAGADYPDAPVDTALAAWVPATTDGVAAVRTRIEAWRRWWADAETQNGPADG